jgi:dipeptidyl aminopeptidase/acylaminoacyl peptidase
VNNETHHRSDDAGARTLLIPRTKQRIFFNDCEEFDFHLQYALSYAPGGAAEIGECFAAVQEVGGYDVDAWRVGWARIAHTISELAREDEANGRLKSARLGYLRSWNYFYQSQCFISPGTDDCFAAHQRTLEQYERAARLPGPEFRRVWVPFDGGDLPAWFFPAHSPQPAPTLIMLTGTDGLSEQLYYFAGGTKAADRGWNLLCVDGPGQIGAKYFNRSQAFRPDYETVIKAVIDRMAALPEVDLDRLALIGFSLGGYLAPRAASGEPRIKALIVDPPVTNFHDLIWPAMERLQAHGGPIGDAAAALFRWIFGMNDLDEVKASLHDYNLDERVEQIRCPTLVLMSEGDDDIYHAQGESFFQRLTVKDKSMRRFSAAEGADAHCQINNWTLLHQVLFDWLETAVPTQHRSL